MIRSMLDGALGLQQKTSDALHEYLYSLNVDLFDDIFTSYTKEEPYYIIMAILLMYSQESPYLIVHSDNEKEKEAICAKLNMPEYIKGWVIEMAGVHHRIRSTIVSFLEYFAGPEWRNLQFLKIQLADIEKIITNKESTDDKGAFSIKDHMSAIRESTRLSTTIDKMEKDIRSRDKHMFIEEVKSTRKYSNKREINKGGNIENSRQID